MRQTIANENGEALLWVLVVMSVGLLIIGALSALTPVNLRVAKFEGDYALALYAAESGVNHAIGLLSSFGGTDVQEAELVAMNELLGSKFVQLGDGVQYKAVVTKDENHSYRYTIDAIGQYEGRQRQVIVNVLDTGGTVFRQYIAQQYRNPDTREEDENFVHIEIAIPPAFEHPAYERAKREHDDPRTRRTCSHLPSLDFSDGPHRYVYIQGPCEGGTQLHIRNATVFVDGDVTLNGGPVDFLLEDGELYVDGSFILDHSQVHMHFGGGRDLGNELPENNVYVQGDMYIGGSVWSVTRTEPAFPPLPWDYIQVQGYFYQGGSDTASSNLEQPHLAIAVGCKTAEEIARNLRKEQVDLPRHELHQCVELRGSDLSFIGGLYAPDGHVVVEQSAQTGIGSIVGKCLHFNERDCDPYDKELAQGMGQNWDGVRQRMRTPKFGTQRRWQSTHWELVN